MVTLMCVFLVYHFDVVVSDTTGLLPFVLGKRHYWQRGENLQGAQTET